MAIERIEFTGDEPETVQLSIDLRMADIEVNARFISDNYAFLTVHFISDCGCALQSHAQCNDEEVRELEAALRIATSFGGSSSTQDHQRAEQLMRRLPAAARWIP